MTISLDPVGFATILPSHGKFWFAMQFVLTGVEIFPMDTLVRCGFAVFGECNELSVILPTLTE